MKIKRNNKITCEKNQGLREIEKNAINHGAQLIVYGFLGEREIAAEEKDAGDKEEDEGREAHTQKEREDFWRENIKASRIVLWAPSGTGAMANVVWYTKSSNLVQNPRVSEILKE